MNIHIRSPRTFSPAAALFALSSVCTTPSLAQETAAAAAAEERCFTTNASVTFTSNYIFRGLTQTNEDPAAQAGLGISFKSGFYANLWGSNVSWFADAFPTTSNSLELDISAGYKGKFNEDLGFDVGLLRYEYPGDYPGLGPTTSEPNTTEAYAALSWRMLSFKYSYSLGDTFGVDDSSGSWYADLTGNLELPHDFLLCLHAGHQDYTGDSGGVSNDSLYSYSDVSVMLSHPIGDGFNLSLSWTHADTEDAGYTIQGENIGESQWALSLSKSF